MELRPGNKPSWKNKRKKSLYNEEAEVGFIFRKPRVQQVADTAVAQPEDKEDIQESASEDVVTEDIDTTQREDLDESLILEVEEGDEELAKEVELKRFIAQLKRELLASNVDKSKADKLDTVLEMIAHDLKQPDLYFRCMQSLEPEKILPHPLEKELRGSIALLQDSMTIFKRELQEWDQVTEESKAQLEHAKQSYSSQKHIDFLNQTPKNTEALESYLTQEQVEVLELATETDTSFITEVTAQLEEIKSRIDQEFELIQQRLQTTMTKIMTTSHLDISTVTETPKTLFRALQNHV